MAAVPSAGSSAQVKLSPAVWSGCRASAVQQMPGWVQWSHKPLSELFLPVQFPQSCVFSSTCQKNPKTLLLPLGPLVSGTSVFQSYNSS